MLRKNEPQNLGSDQKPTWIKANQTFDCSKHSCDTDLHRWVAYFLQSGRLAYWKCEACGQEDRESETYPEQFDVYSCWIDDPLKLISISANPPKSSRKWATKEETILVEAEPSSIHYMGMDIPELAAAHTYIEYNQAGQILRIYEPVKERIRPYDDHYILIRFQVVAGELIRFWIHCFEDSMYEIPNASKPKETVVLSELVLLQ